MSVLVWQEYRQFKDCLEKQRDKLTEEEIGFFEKALRDGADETPIPDGWAIQCRMACIRIWRDDQTKPRPYYLELTDP